jgi:hypothetical protein
MRILSAAILIASVTTASAQLGKDASYFCLAEAVGGLSYDERTKKWIGSSLRADKKFVLRLKFLNNRVEKSIFNQDETVYDYNVTITEAGSNFVGPCLGSGQKHVTVRPLGWLLCHGADLHEYRFDLDTNRFLSAYLHGFINGKASNDDTPAVMGGTCTKID